MMTKREYEVKKSVCEAPGCVNVRIDGARFCQSHDTILRMLSPYPFLKSNQPEIPDLTKYYDYMKELSFGVARSYSSIESAIGDGAARALAVVTQSDDYQEFLRWKDNQKKEKELEGKPMEQPKRLITVE